MVLNLREFEVFPVHVFLTGNPDQLKPDYESLCGVNEVHVEADIQKSGDEYFVQAQVDASVTLECARCLTRYQTRIGNSTDFIICSEEEYQARTKKAADDEDYVFFRGGELQADITEMVKQAIILSLTLKPLCKDDCKGLCPICGANRNEVDCGCEQDKIDPRWDALKKLRNSLSET